jgi:hypothetical protein
VLEAAFILLEFPSLSRRIFIGSHSLPSSLVRRIGPSIADDVSNSNIYIFGSSDTHMVQIITDIKCSDSDTVLPFECVTLLDGRSNR